MLYLTSLVRRAIHPTGDNVQHESPRSGSVACLRLYSHTPAQMDRLRLRSSKRHSSFRIGPCAKPRRHLRSYSEGPQSHASPLTVPGRSRNHLLSQPTKHHVRNLLRRLVHRHRRLSQVIARREPTGLSPEDGSATSMPSSRKHITVAQESQRCARRALRRSGMLPGEMWAFRVPPLMNIVQRDCPTVIRHRALTSHGVRARYCAHAATLNEVTSAPRVVEKPIASPTRPTGTASRRPMTRRPAPHLESRTVIPTTPGTPSGGGLTTSHHLVRTEPGPAGI